MFDSLLAFVDVKQVIPLPSVYDDSTHRIYRVIDRHDHHYCLKVIQGSDSVFWQGMRSVFGVDIVNDPINFRRIYACLRQWTPLTMPALIEVNTPRSHSQPGWLLTEWLEGEPASSKLLDSVLVVGLAEHLVALHRYRQSTWGKLGEANRYADEWSEALKQWLLLFLPDDEEVKSFNTSPKSFVPLMLDLRWDQFLKSDNRLSALLDLDAFVFAPIELDFVILEYLMPHDLLSQWFEVYKASGGDVPSLESVRGVYRKFLFSLNVLGEVDLPRWMSHSHFFVG